MEKQYSINEVSQLLGISKDTLRYYDRIGIVSPSREHNAYRRYSQDDLVALMNIQIMQYADFSLEEIKGKLRFHRMQNVDPDTCQEVAEFLDAKKAETRKKIAHLEKVSQLLDLAVETLRDFNHESDQRLAVFVQEIYRELHKKDPGFIKECDGHSN
ncbi:MerR family transcriptional regulator [Paenibacillus campinasensis]|uniref:MerR family transcriptional regulator n=1 Tax=Paenibacillus campinasensis TaxID=66347 RepID=A0ABW9T7R5_9BACL|nr:MerR family transcriptional regulator [Paenibacillus campinasensis]MUG68441.1 MerR family transcriptional regulator [Paenibacillus campinasensis]